MDKEENKEKEQNSLFESFDFIENDEEWEYEENTKKEEESKINETKEPSLANSMEDLSKSLSESIENIKKKSSIIEELKKSLHESFSNDDFTQELEKNKEEKNKHFVTSWLWQKVMKNLRKYYLFLYPSIIKVNIGLIR